MSQSADRDDGTRGVLCDVSLVTSGSACSSALLTVTVRTQGPVYTFDGHDDQCDAGPRSSVVGTAVFNQNGSVGIGFTTVLAPGGGFVHVSARINALTLRGP